MLLSDILLIKRPRKRALRQKSFPLPDAVFRDRQPLLIDSVISAKSKESQKVQTIIIISSVPLPQIGLPEKPDTGFCILRIGNQTGLCICCSDRHRMQRVLLQDLSIDLIYFCPLLRRQRFAEKSVETIHLFNCPLIFGKPCVIQRYIGDGTVCITVIPVMPPAPSGIVFVVRRSIIQCIFST